MIRFLWNRTGLSGWQGLYSLVYVEGVSAPKTKKVMVLTALGSRWGAGRGVLEVVGLISKEM